VATNEVMCTQTTRTPPSCSRSQPAVRN
jgi:hypothetical protein